MTDHNVKFPAATGLTGLISRGLGFHPFIAAGLKYAVIIATVFGAVKYWENLVADNAVKDTVIETQQGVIGAQADAAANQAEATESKEAHVKTTNERETTTQERILQNQARQLAKLEKDYETLKALANDRPDLRKPWPDSLQRRGGFDLNRSPTQSGDKTSTDRGGDPD